MRKISFQHKNKVVSVEIPEMMNELTQEQYIYVMSIARDGNSDDDTFISVMANIPIDVVKKASDYEKFKILELFGFLSENAPFSEIKIKNFEIDGVQYDGPRASLINSTFLEFVFADTYFLRHIAGEKNIKYKMIACLYRKHAIDEDSEMYEGDTREKFSEHRLEKRAKQFEKLSDELVSGIIYNYAQIRQLMEKRYVFIFPEPEKEKKESNSKKEKQNFSGWAKTFKKFVDEDLVNEEKYAAMNLHRVLETINNRIKNNLKNG